MLVPLARYRTPRQCKPESAYSRCTGQVILKNGAVIENAIDGITTIGNVEDMSSWDWSKTGGIIKAENRLSATAEEGFNS